MEFTEQKRLISHLMYPETIESIVRTISEKITLRENKSSADLLTKLEILTKLTEFDFGRYLLKNQGLNGYWTHYMLTHPWYGRKTGKNNSGKLLTDLEKFLLDQAPIILATQQRFEIFLNENQKELKNNAKLACIPSGMMGELLYLNYKDINSIELVGIDYDPDTLNDAQTLANQQGLGKFLKLIQQDAWELGFQEAFDLISSNGLNIYEPSDEKVTELYRQFYTALKVGGKLVTSFLTPPPSLTTHCEWNMPEVNQHDLLNQKLIFADVIDVKWQCYRSSDQTYEQLRAVGFENINFVYDKAKMFPTVVAIK